MTEPTRQQILDAAAKVYAELGFRGATTRRIAEVAGVNEVTLFRTFGSKANLIDEVIRSCHRDPDAASLPAEPAEPEAELSRWVAETHRFMLDRRGLIRSAVAELHEHPEHSNEVADHPTVSFRELRAYVDRLHRTGAIPDVANANAACTMLLGTLFSDALHRDVMPSMFPPAPDAPRTYVRLFLRALGATAAVGLAILLLAAAPMALTAQGGVVPTATAPTATSAPATLSLLDALRRAEQKSEGVAIAAAGVTRAKGVQQQANSARLPQANGSVAYQRAIQNQFASISERFSDPNDTTSGGGFTDSPIARIFAAPNTAIFSLNVSQTLYSAGRIPAARAGAAAGRTAAEIAYDAAKAQALLEVAQAYFDAVAADQFVAIAESSLVLTDRALTQVALAREVGTAAEFDLIRAQVARDNQRPVVIQASGVRTAAYLRLKQLLDLPLTGPLTLTTPIRDEAAAAAASPTAPIVLADARTVQPDTAVSARATVRQAEAQVRAQEGALRAAKLARLPALQLSSTYQRFAYPPEGTFLPSALDLYFPNWNVTLGLSVPVLTGGRLRGERLVAEANLTEARERLQQSREGASVDALLTISQYEQAQAAYAASVGTDTQAQRAYAIAEVRFREGLSTSLELTQVRVQLEQARLQRVTAARDLEVARLRLALLKDLPLPLQGGR